MPSATRLLSANSGATGIQNAAMFMRPEGDGRKDAVVKREIFDREIRDSWRIAPFDIIEQSKAVLTQTLKSCLQRLQPAALGVSIGPPHAGR